MNQLEKQNRSLIKKIAVLLKRPIRSGSAVVLNESDTVRLLIATRCIECEENTQRMSIEVMFAVQVFALPVLWSKYSGRKLYPETYSAVLPLQKAVFPDCDLPDWWFQVSMDDRESIDGAINRVVAVARTRLLPIAEKCETAADILALNDEGLIAVHRFDRLLLLFLTGRYDECQLALAKARLHFSDPQHGPTNPAILLSMCDKLADDLGL